VIAQYGGKRKGIKLGHGEVKPLEVFGKGVKSDGDETLIRTEPKRRSSLRVWREDHELVAEVLERFEGKTQPEKVARWARWTLEQFQKVPAAIESGSAIEPKLEPESALQQEEPQEEIEAIQSQPIQTIESIQSESPSAPTLETKIDSLVNAIAHLVDIQTKALTTPMTIATSTPATRQRATTPTAPAQAEGEGQLEPERKYKPRGQNEELVNKAIDAIMQHNDGVERHDDKWAITINGLKAWIGSQHAITKGLEARKKEVEAHHQKHQIDEKKHNLKHRGKTKIEDVIKVE